MAPAAYRCSFCPKGVRRSVWLQHRRAGVTHVEEGDRGAARGHPGAQHRGGRAVPSSVRNGLHRTVSRFVDIVGHLADRGCDAVALACTEIPLAVTPSNSPLPVLDSGLILAEAAADVATGARPLPGWRGG